ncbi:carbonyl reductase [NADPH] 1-like isoform X2 [Branchiostoma lanceolatum]|uniref:carbonyl reductase [NADPH] 1-like isoform X2 n=1 Tax=Branchiostoma lanceolatum TaxID=7740 RepID=UPI003451C75B
MCQQTKVTGGNKGIGLAIVKGLCKQFNGTVYLTARDASRGQEAVKELNEQGCQPRFHQLDVSSLDSIHRFKQHLEQEHQGLDVLVNNAGVMYGRSNPTPLVEQVDVTMGINFFGTANLTKVLKPLLRPHARIVNVSSGLCDLSKATPERRQTFRSEQLTEEELVQMMEQFVSDVKSGVHEEKGWEMELLAYRVSKMGVTALSMVLQRQFDATPGADVVVNAVCPGWVKTDMGGASAGRSVEKGAETPLYLALLPPNVSSPRGKFLRDKEILSF